MSSSYSGDYNGTDTAGLIEDRLDALLGRATGPVMWDALSGEDAAAQWQALRSWVSWFRTTFAVDHRVVPPCWYRHDAVVELLSALRDHWRAAYDPLNSPTAASEWHRVLAQLEPRLREWAARTGCTPTEHRPDARQAYPDDEAAWADHVREDLARRSLRLHEVNEAAS
jgi:hypothetical protein